VTKGVLVLLGSGETAPGMTKIHREVLSRLGEVRAVNLDTAYGFQENVPQMTEKLVDYFATSLQTALAPLHFTSYEESSDLERTIFKQQVRAANYVFAGPGSPTWALSQWRPLVLDQDLQGVLDADGTVCFASAAALTLGAFTAPIYEIYKAGVKPYWLEGLNITAAMGLNCVIIPHFDNQEGSNYDTSCCYLGARRLRLMESQLPGDVATLGVDEHTALIIDLKGDSLKVLGRSNGYWRLGGESRVLANGSTTPLEELRTLTLSSEPQSEHIAPEPVSDPVALGHIAAGGGTQGLEALAQLVQLAVSGGVGYIDPTTLVDGILAARENARMNGKYELADELRAALSKAGIDVQDSPEGSSWTLAGGS
jgi:hypothetical protein